MTNPKSTAQIAGHPIHPMLIPFPVACFVLAFVSDMAFWRTSNDSGPRLALAARHRPDHGRARGRDRRDRLMGDDRIRNLNDAWLHAGGNVIAVVIELYNWYSRYTDGTVSHYTDRPGAVVRRGADPALHRLERLGDGLSPSAMSRVKRAEQEL